LIQAIRPSGYQVVVIGLLEHQARFPDILICW